MKTEPCVVVVQTCRGDHETAYAVANVEFSDVLMGTKVLDLPDMGCLWPDCTEEITKSGMYSSKVVRYGE